MKELVSFHKILIRCVVKAVIRLKVARHFWQKIAAQDLINSNEVVESLRSPKVILFSDFHSRADHRLTGKGVIKSSSCMNASKRAWIDFATIEINGIFSFDQLWDITIQDRSHCLSCMSDIMKFGFEQKCELRYAVT